MTKKLEIPIGSVKAIVRQFVRQFCPHETNAFEMSFGQLTNWPHHWQHVEPTKWKVEDLLVEAAAGSGYAFPGTIPPEIPPWFHFGLVVHAVTEHFLRLAKVPEANEIEAAYKNFGSLCELPQEAFDLGKPVAIKFVQSYFRHGATVFFPAVGYVVYEGQKRHRFSEENKLEKFRAKKRTYEIYVDDLRCEILVGKEKPDLLAGETSNFLLLKCLLRRVGAHWTHEELFEQLSIPDPTDTNSKVSIEAARRSLLHRRINAVRKSLSAKTQESRVKHWFDTKNPKRVAVAADLNSCLIESLS